MIDETESAPQTENAAEPSDHFTATGIVVDVQLMHAGIPGVEEWPATQIVMKPINDLVPYPNNARTHTEEQIAQIAAAMREWGWTTPVLTDEDGVVIAGHGRIMAARSLGLRQIPTMVARGWSDAQKRAYGLADNRLALAAGWDPEMLRVELSDLEAGGYDLALTGFSEDEIALHAREPNFDPAGMDEQSRLDEKKPVHCPECGHEFTPP